MKRGVPSFGVFSLDGPLMVDHMAKAGVDFIMFDMMFWHLDWGHVSHVVRAAKTQGIFPFVRIQAYPWVGARSDPRLVVDAARALSTGAEGVAFSVRSAAEVAEVVQAAGDWHRNLPFTSAEELREHEQSVAENTWIMPLLETRSAIEEYEAILDIEGVKAVFVGVTDLAEKPGHPFDYEHPSVWKAIDNVVAQAHKRGVAVCANDGFIYTTPETKAARLARLRQHGVDLLHMQMTEFLAYLTARNTIELTRRALEAS